MHEGRLDAQLPTTLGTYSLQRQDAHVNGSDTYFWRSDEGIRCPRSARSRTYERDGGRNLGASGLTWRGNGLADSCAFTNADSIRQDRPYDDSA